MTLSIFRIRDPFYNWVTEFMTHGIKVGEAEVSLWSVTLFILVIWISVVVTRIIRHILEKDVFSRVQTAKGIPSTVSLMARVILLTAGFFLAAAAAGIKLSSLSLILGAFSVGIGFGLQNIFNNMVSGIILALERPIKVGDIVQVGELLGVVKSIGLRSSTVKSFDGAEVIVPNGNLISQEMINWTLSDSNRRIDIRVGVAYGTKPGQVVELMQEVAEANERVDKKPPPTAYFIEFGDSSLNFRLLAWTDMAHRLEVESELNMAVNEALQKAGIEIPFPQVDLNIKKDLTKVSAAKRSKS
jgi:small-conductance mechanosensitive channel